MGLANMATKQTDLQRDMAFGQVALITATPDEDMKENTDYVIGSLRIAYRKRRISVKRYGQISIRESRLSGTQTEREKILKGTSRAHLYVFEYPDAYIICRLADIKKLLQQGKTEVVNNHDGLTRAEYINISDLPHLIIERLNNGHG